MSPRIAVVLIAYATFQRGAVLAADPVPPGLSKKPLPAEVRVEAPRTQAEPTSLDRGVAKALLDAGVNDTLRLFSWPVTPDVKRTLKVTRYDVYAPEAKVLKVERGGAVEVPRSPLRFFTGVAEGDSGTRALVIVDPRTSTVTAFTETASGSYELLPAAAGDAQVVVPRSSRSILETQADMNCVATCGPPAPPDPFASIWAPLTSLHTATIAVETDNELMLNTFNDNTTAATDYLAQMFAGVNVIYERDHFVRLLQGTTLLRVSTTPDPYNDVESSLSMQLGEVYVQWQNNYSHVQRAQVIALSGLSIAPGSGLSGVNTLCQGSISLARIPGVTNPLGPVALVGHELGHAFGAIHSHCAYDPLKEPSDKCWNGESNRTGCWAGANECPAPTTMSGVPNVQGTIMSYCHRIGCPASPVFHPDSANAISQALTSKIGVCVFDATPKFSIEGQSVPEGQTGNTLLHFTIKLGAPLSAESSVAFAVTGGGATADTDFVSRSGRFTMPAGTTSKNLVLVVKGDNTVESNETIQVTISSPQGAALDPGATSAFGTITNDDPVGVANTVVQYRLYHDGTKEHLYTTDLNEYNILGTRGWVQEGPAYTMFSNPGTSGGVSTVPFFRLYHAGTQQHLWTTDYNEALVLSDFTTWAYEGIIGYLLPSSGSGTVPLYRMNLPFPPIHLWTTDLNEYTVLANRGWIQEGAVGHARP
jgi:hypothetical protein